METPALDELRRADLPCSQACWVSASLMVEVESEVDRLKEIAAAALDLYERVEMDESVGICLSDRVPSLRLGSALRAAL